MIPLTILKTIGGTANADCVHHVHKAEMYDDGLWTLASYKSQYTCPNMNSKVVVKWFGAEQYLFNLVDALAGDRIDHLVYKDFFLGKAGSDQPPCWVFSNAYTRQMVELAMWDDIHRFKKRWITQRRVGVLPDFRAECTDGMDELDRAAENINPYRVGMSPTKYYTKEMFYSLNRRYRVYTTSLSSFFNRNRYSRFIIGDHRRWETVANVQRVLPTRRVIDILRRHTAINTNRVNFHEFI